MVRSLGDGAGGREGGALRGVGLYICTRYNTTYFIFSTVATSRVVYRIYINVQTNAYVADEVSMTSLGAFHEVGAQIVKCHGNSTGTVQQYRRG